MATTVSHSPALIDKPGLFPLLALAVADTRAQAAKRKVSKSRPENKKARATQVTPA